MTEQVVSLRITADGKVAVQVMNQVGDAGQRMGTQARQGGQRAAQGMDATRASAERLSVSAASAKESVLKLFAAAGGAAVLGRSAVSAADAWAGLTARLRLATKSKEEYAIAEAAVFAISQRTSTQLEATAALYSKLSNSMSGTGTSQRELLALTETINQTFAISGASTTAQANAIMQLTQAFAGGVLRAEEYNSVLENGDRLAKAIAAGLGVSMGELRRQVNEGEVTVARLVGALRNQSGVIQGEFQQMPLTVGRAWTQLENIVVKTVGELGQSSGAIALVTSSLVALGGNLNVVITALAAFGAARAAAVIQAAVLDAAQRKSAVSAVAEAEAQVAKARAMQLATGSTTALAAAEARLAVAQEAATAAGVGKLGMLGRMGSSLLGLAGGPIGVAVLAVGGLIAAMQALANAEEERARKFTAGVKATQQAAESIDGLVAQIERARQRYDQLPDFAATAKQWTSATEQLTASTASLTAKRSEMENIEARIEAAQRSTSEGASAALIALLPKLERVKGEYAALEEVVNRLAGSLGRLNFDQFFNPSAAQVAGDQAGQAFALLTAGAKKAEEQIEKNKQGQIGYWQALANTRIESARASGASAERVAAMQAENDAMLKTIGSTLKKEATTKSATNAGAEFVAQLQKQVATFGLTDAASMRYDLSSQKLTASQRAQAAALIATLEEWDRYSQVTKTAADAIETLTKGNADLDEQIAQGRDKLAGLSDAQVKHNAALREANKLARDALVLGPPTADVQKAMEDRLAKLTELQGQDGALDASTKKAAELEEILSRFGEIDGFDKLVSDIERVGSALEGATDPATIERMQRALGKLNQEMEQRNLTLMQQGVSSLQSFAKEGTAAYTALGIAQDVLAYKSAVAAIANQGSGDPYSAFARIAAMIALMASIGIRISGGGGGNSPSAQSAEVRQQTQGTGSVLGDSTAKSESIRKATEITANATQQLVGLNRGMLTALVSLQNALGAAGNQLARGAGDVSFPSVGGGFNIGDPFGGDPLGGAIGSFLFGGGKKVIDQGIIIAGGALNDMLNQIVVGAYRTIHKDGGLFGSDKTYDQMQDISDSFGKQFQLVISSIADTVRQGALALGMLPADVEAAIAAYRIEETRISLKGLSAEDQQKELEAVFSKIFDGLAGAVVPYIGQFQQVGEGLGETLVRIATEVQVVQEGFKQLGFAIDQSGPEKFAQIADGLIQAAGGIDAFVSGMQSFVANFATDEHQFTVASTALSSALDQVGLAVPATRDGMWELMQSLDATTEEGREQIATLLRLADVANEYYNSLEQRAKRQAKEVADATEYLDGLGLGSGLSEFGRELQSIKASSAQAVDAANLLARAQGREGASTMEIARIHDWTAKQIAAAIRRLQAETRDLIAKLYGGMPGTLDEINSRIAELEGAANNVGDSVGGGIDRIAEAGNNLFEQWAQGVQSVQEYLDSMLLGDLSSLKPEEKIDEAKRQLLALQEAALRGDADALGKLPQMADAYLRLLRSSEVSGGDFNAGSDWVRQLLESVVGLPNPGTRPGGSQNPGGGGTVTMVPSPELAALYAERDARLAEQETAYRAQLAQQLAEHLADLSASIGTPIFELIAAQGVNLRELATDLGADLSNLTGASVEVLGNMATTLGVPLGELVQQLGLSMPELRDGITELTNKLGIDLGLLTTGTGAQIAATTQQLASLAGSLGTNLRGLSESLGIDLGKLTAVDSPIFVALGKTIDSLSPDIKTELTPLLDAVRSAAGDEAKNEAVKKLRDHVDNMAPGIKNLLGPYFDDIKPGGSLDQLDFLEEIRNVAKGQLTALGDIKQVLRDANRAASVPGYAVGSAYIAQDHLAMVHQGEGIVDATSWRVLQRYGIRVATQASNDDTRAVVIELQALKAEVAALRRENSNGHSKTAQAVQDGDAKARSQRDAIAGRQAPRDRSDRYGRA